VNAYRAQRFYINGQQVVEVVRPPSKPGETIPLQDRAVEALKAGDNLIAVFHPAHVRSSGADHGLQAAK